MANITFYTAVDFSKVGFTDGYVTSSSETKIVFKSYSGNKSAVYTGRFSYDEYGDIDGGKITGITWSSSGVKQYTFSNGSIDVWAYADFEYSKDATGLLRHALRQNDTIKGSSSSDKLYGWNGNDNVYGNGGNDRLVGGIGKDTLYGGSGRDYFDFNNTLESGTSSSSRDLIKDFVRGTDKIDLASIDANTNASGNNAFSKLISSASSFTTPGQLKLTNGVLYGNTDTDSSAEFSIQLSGISKLSLSDFVL